MPVEWRDVISDNVARVGFDDETQMLLVTWQKSGKTSAYGPGVSPELFDSVSKSWSVTDAINSEIKPQFSHKYI